MNTLRETVNKTVFTQNYLYPPLRYSVLFIPSSYPKCLLLSRACIAFFAAIKGRSGLIHGTRELVVHRTMLSCMTLKILFVF